jgi:predicted DNA-binding protein with PD1-like motif
MSANSSDTTQGGRLLRLSDAHFPESLDHALAEHGIQSGWLSGTAILEDVELRVFDPVAGRAGARRRITGRLEAVSLAGPIVSTENGPFCQLRAVLSRETETGIETFAGQLASARVLLFDGFLHGTGLAPLDVAAEPRVPHVPHVPQAPPSAPSAPSPWAQAISASTERDDDSRPQHDERAYTSPKQNAPTLSDPSPMPRPPQKPRSTAEELFPEAGDLADHFAFGRCEIIKSDGDRLHLKIPRDGRIKEIALEMLKVSLKDEESGKRVYRLDRKL